MNIKIQEPEQTQKKKLIAFELPESWYQTLKKSADDELLSVSNLIRIILYKNYLEPRLTERKEKQ